MKCPKCDSEMICDKTTTGNPPQCIHECKKCGTLAYSNAVEFGIAQIVPTEIAFTCVICGESQPYNYFAPVYFPVCDKCKSDLKNYVLSIRNSGSNVIECKVCHKPFGDKLSLYEHYDSEHNLRSFL